jgi:predicted Zn-dependent protease
MPGLPRVPRVPRRTLVAGGAVALALVTALSIGSMLRGSGAGKYPELVEMLDAGKFNEARTEIDRRLKATPEDAALLLLRGHALAAIDEVQAARDSYQQAIRLDPELAEDSRMHTTALAWLERPSPETMTFWRESIGKAGLKTLRDATENGAERSTRWNAIKLRQELRDSKEPDLVSVAIKDLAAGSDCGALRNAAEIIAKAKDKRGLEPLQDARGKLNLIDQICAGPLIDSAIRTLTE